ncbi:carboxymuconolactone decarboxylase family protein [Rothia nasimurium]|uniref:carboxymuconolactone decarboxylase family protein n=1 Tax=Rothia nasimurium TaxID=85336 RepID=UPI00390837DC
MRISQINGCAYCLKVHTKRAIKAGLSATRTAAAPTKSLPTVPAARLASPSSSPTPKAGSSSASSPTRW